MAAGGRDAANMDPGFDNLESSLSLDDSLLGQAGSIDNLYHTYLGNMDTYPSGSAAQGAGRLDTYGAAGYENYGGQYQDETRSSQALSIVDWRGEVSCSTYNALKSSVALLL